MEVSSSNLPDIRLNENETVEISVPENNSDHYNPSVRELNILKSINGSVGFALSRSKWDPYPWVSTVYADGPAHLTGLKVGDCVLEVNGNDVLGMRISEVGDIVKARESDVTLIVWSSGAEATCNPDSICCGPMPINFERLSSCMQTILASLECPVCMDTISPPAGQCINSHLICSPCRSRSENCPVCRQKYTTGRALLAEQIHNSITEAFKINETESKLREKLFSAKCVEYPQKYNIKNDEFTKLGNPKNKFLARLWGKTVSMENISKKPNNVIESTHTHDDSKLSLSVERMCCSNPVSRVASPLMQRRNKSEFGTEVILGTRRPLSHHCSYENVNVMNSSGPQTNELSVALKNITQVNQFHCPTDYDCNKICTDADIRDHVLNEHNIPILDLGTSTIELALPPQAPLERAFFILNMDRMCFWIKLNENNGTYFLTPTAQTSNTSDYYVEATIFDLPQQRHLSNELISRSPITPLKFNELAQNPVNDKKICFSLATISATFNSESSLRMKVSIKRNE